MNFDIYGISSPVTPKELPQGKKRLYSFLWRFAIYLVVVAGNYMVENISDLGLSEGYVVLVTLVIGEITKYLNTGRQK